MGKAHSKISCRSGTIKIVYSVCGHIEKCRENEGVDPRYCLLGIEKSWMPKNTECRAGWCPACTEHWKRHQLNTVNEEFIQAYWNYMARHRWTRPIEPCRIRTSALRRGITTKNTKQWPAYEAVAACLYSLHLDITRSRFRTLTAAKIIRDDTLAWASRLQAEVRARAQQKCSEALRRKPLPRTPGLREPSWDLPASLRREDTQVSVFQHLHSAIDNILQDLQWTSDEAPPVTETDWASNGWAEPNSDYFQSEDDAEISLFLYGVIPNPQP